MEVINIVNPNLENQRITGAWVQAGFKAAGIDCTTTHDRGADADVIVVHGPNYALETARNKDNVLWLDRCWYGDTNNWASLGWLRDGCRWWPEVDHTPGRFIGHIDDGYIDYAENYVKGSEILLLDDYDETLLRTYPIDAEVLYRPHPHCVGRYPGAGDRSGGNLHDALDGVGLVITAAGTSGAYAALRGIPVVCLDPRNVVYPISASDMDGYVDMSEKSRFQWACNLAWRQWTGDEISSGAFWSVLGTHSMYL